MTLWDLRQYRSIKAEARRIQRRMHELRMSNDCNIKELKALYDELDRQNRKALAAELEIQRKLEQINDAQVRVSIQMHYIDGCTWNEVADEIGGNNTDVACRKYVSRYLKNQSDKSQNMQV